MLIENFLKPSLKLITFYNYYLVADSKFTEDGSATVELLVLVDNKSVTIKKLIDQQLMPVVATNSLKGKFKVQEVNPNSFMDYLLVFSIGKETSV
jgi:hypothetical protein